MVIFQATVDGNLPRKSNSRIWAGPGRLIKSKKALEFESNASVILQYYKKVSKNRFGTVFPIVDDVVVSLLIHYRTKKSDLSGELFFDILERSGVLQNDRQIKIQYLAGTTSKKPKVECWITQKENAMWMSEYYMNVIRNNLEGINLYHPD